MNINDEHAELLGLALADISHTLNQLLTAGVMDKEAFLDLYRAIPEQVRTACGNPITRVEAEEYNHITF